MITLGPGDTLYGSATGGNVVYTLFGTPSPDGPAQIIRQGFFASAIPLVAPSSPVEIYSISLANVTPGTSVTFRLYVLGTSNANKLYTASIPDGGTATYGEGKWTLYAASGVPLGTGGGGGGLTDGDYGDITVGGGGTTLTVDSGLPATRIGTGSVDNTEFGYLNGATSNIQTQINAKANDSAVVHTSGAEIVGGVKTFTSDPIIPDESYADAWNGTMEPPTKNAVYDKFSSVEADIIAMAVAL